MSVGTVGCMRLSSGHISQLLILSDHFNTLAVMYSSVNDLEPTAAPRCRFPSVVMLMPLQQITP